MTPLALDGRRRPSPSVAAMTAVVVSGTSATTTPATPADDTQRTVRMVEVTTATSCAAEELDGTVDHGTPRPFVLAAAGTLTSLPSVGDVIERRRDDRRRRRPPVIVLSRADPVVADARPGGRRRQGRPRSWSSSLAALGYAEEHDVESTTSGPARRRERRRRRSRRTTGRTTTATVDLGEMVWIDGPVRIDSVDGALGQAGRRGGDHGDRAPSRPSRRRRRRRRRPAPLGTAVDVELPSGETRRRHGRHVGATETERGGMSTCRSTLTLRRAPRPRRRPPVDGASSRWRRPTAC